MTTSNETPDQIYRALKQGRGHEWVNDGNAEAVIEVAREHGDVQTEYLVREWRSTCGKDAHMPDLAALDHQLPPAGGPKG